MKAGPEGQDATELEQAARSRMKAEEREKRRSREEADKLQAAMAAEKGKPAWGSKGVHALLDEDYSLNENDSPIVPRRSLEDEVQSVVYPMSEEKTEPAKKTTSAAVTGSGWAPAGYENSSQSKADSYKYVISKALQQSQPPAHAVATPSDGMETALKLLGETLTHERQRSVAAEERAARLEAQLASVTAQLLEANAKTVERLEREDERKAAVHK